MTPVVTDGAKPKHEPSPNAVAAPRPSRPSSPAPTLSAAAEKPGRPVLLSLNLKGLGTKGMGRPEHDDTAPPSPSSRSKAKVGRSVTEKPGHKRGIDDKDGPGHTNEQSRKRQRVATPPGSPRSGDSPMKQMVKSPRAVKNLAPLAGEALRRHATASPPSSPRGGADAQPSLVGSPGRARTDSSLPARAPVALTGAAPKWRSTSEPDMPDDLLTFSPLRHVTGDGDINSAAPGRSLQAQLPLPLPGHVPSSDADLTSFTFAECDFGESGELVLTPRQVSSAVASASPSGATLSEATALSITMVAAELLPKAKLQREAAIAYRAALAELMRLTDSEKNNDPAQGLKVLESAFKTAQDDLESEMIVSEIALGGANADDIAIYLRKIVRRIAACSGVIASSTTYAPAVSTSAAVAIAGQNLSASLDAMDVACKVGITMLAEECLASITSAATPGVPPPQGFLVSTPSDLALLDDLDTLMDQEIVTATSVPAIKAPAENQ